MIKDLNIKQYRLFKELNIDNLSQVNLIVGTNNSGKTSLLEAIHLFSNADIRTSLAYILHQRGEFTLKSLDRLDRELEMAHLFYGHLIAIGSSIKLESKSANAKLSLSIQEESGLSRSIHPLALVCELEKDKNDYDSTSIDLTADGLFNVHPNYDLRATSRVNQTSNLVTAHALNYIELAALWDHITLTPKEDQVIAALQILEPAVERISFTSTWTADSGVLVRLANEVKPVPLGSMGDGMRRILAIIASLVSAGNGNLLIDEIDTGLYHGVLTDGWIESVSKLRSLAMMRTN